MKWIRFQHAKLIAYGLLEGHQVRQVEGSPFEEHRLTSTYHDLKDIELLTPIAPGAMGVSNSMSLRSW